MGLLGLAIAIACILVAQLLSGGSLLALIDFPAFLIVFGGTMGAIILQTPLSALRIALLQLAWVVNPPKSQLLNQAERFEKWSMSARQYGLLALEDLSDDEPCEFTKMGLNLLVDGTDSDHIKQLLETEIDIEQEKLEQGAKVYEAMGGYSPTIGIIGAVLGLIQAMAHLDNPSELGEGIAVAFVATIYGVGFANLLYLPISNKLRAMHYQIYLYQELTMQGLLAIASGESGLQLRHRFQVYLRE
ncbi:flagellar motor protein [Dongshaea marina]|uniref:flagellar motor protein n=1 Tax=Dongshaea marina TaxID=2047966 RepID=UPI000D3EE1EE|nr:flagellar motor protein [Dongshaea marina]